MARLPQPGGDNGNWGTILNDFLSQSITSEGALKPNSVGATQLKSDAVTAASIANGSITETLLSSGVQTKLNTVAPVTSVASRTGVVVLTKSDVNLGNVDNTSDANKPVSAAQQTAINTAANADSVDGTAITTSTALQALVNTAAATGKAVRLTPGQVIAMTSTVTIPTQGGIVCDSIALWKYGAPDVLRPQLVAQTGFTGPLLKIGVDGAICRGVRLRGFDVDGNSVAGVTYGIYFNTAGTDVENSHSIDEVAVRRVTAGTGIAGRVRTTEFHNVNVFECKIGVQAGAAGPWFDCRWTNGYVVLSKDIGVELDKDSGGVVSAFVQFTNIRVERTGQLPNDPKNAGNSVNWNDSAPGWFIKAATVCTWLSCTTDANNGPAVKISVAGSGLGYATNNLSFTNCVFDRDGQGTGHSMDAGSAGVNIAGLSSSGVDHPGKISFINCRVVVGQSADDGSSSYEAPAYGVIVDHIDHFRWIGNAFGITKGISFGTKDLWKPEVMDNYAEIYLTANTFTTSVPDTSNN